MGHLIEPSSLAEKGLKFFVD